MAQRKKAGTKAKKKTASRTPARKTAKKKTAKKKPAAKKKALKNKAAKKKTTKKKAAVKKTAKKTARSASSLPPKPLMVEPGPPPREIPPVEEPAEHEEAVGVVTHYYSHLSVAVVQLNKGVLKTGETIRVKGHSTNFTQTVESMEYEHQHVDEAAAGQNIGLRVKDHVRVHDIVFRVR
jgi:putative protease